MNKQLKKYPINKTAQTNNKAPANKKSLPAKEHAGKLRLKTFYFNLIYSYFTRTIFIVLVNPLPSSL